MSHAKTLIKIKLPVQWKNTKIIIDKLRSLLLQLNSFKIFFFFLLRLKSEYRKKIVALKKFLQWKEWGVSIKKKTGINKKKIQPKHND